MNESQFDNNLRAVFTVPESESSLDHKIDRALDRFKSARTVRRRITFTLAAGTAVVAGVTLFPAVKAQASMGGIISALDSKTSVKATTFSMDEQGNRWPMATTIIANGETSYVDARRTRQQLDLKDRSLYFDSSIHSFVQSPKRASHGIKLSDMLGSASQFSISKRVSVERVNVGNKELLRATIKNGDLPERYIIDADPDSQLPQHVTIESLELGTWRPRQVVVFDYKEGLQVDKADLSKFPVVTKEQAAANFEKAMTKSSMATIPLRKGNLIIRALDVADDGSVYVMFQAGNREPHTWRGYGIGLSDDLGTEYVRAGDLFSVDEGSIPTDGKFECEVFVPRKPIHSSIPRNFKLIALLTKEGDLERIIQATVVGKDGKKVTQWFPNSGRKAKQIEVLTKSFTGSTCAIRPEWAAKIAYHFFGNDVFAEMTKASYRAKVAMENKDWKEAESQLNEQLRQMRESERLGYSPWDQSKVKENLKVVEAKLKP